jgi:hypothetical protein
LTRGKSDAWRAWSANINSNGLFVKQYLDWLIEQLLLRLLS